MQENTLYLIPVVGEQTLSSWLYFLLHLLLGKEKFKVVILTFRNYINKKVLLDKVS